MPLGLRFGAHVLDPRSRTLTREGRSVPLQEQPLELLMLLVERADTLVTRDDIRARLWPDVVIDYDMGINYAVRQIRLALGPDRRLLQTVPRRGYRLIGPVVPIVSVALCPLSSLSSLLLVTSVLTAFIRSAA